MARARLTAITSKDGEVQVYWHESDDSTVFGACTVSWSPCSTITALESGYGFAATEMSEGGQIGLYHRNLAGILRSLQRSEDGSIWSTASLDVS